MRYDYGFSRLIPKGEYFSSIVFANFWILLLIISGTARADVFTLGFDWPNGIRAKVVENSRRVEKRFAGNDVQQSDIAGTLSYEMKLTRVGNGFLVSFTNIKYELDNEANSSKQPQDRIQSLLNRIGAVVRPDFVVDSQGALVEVVNIEAQQKSLESYWASILPEDRAPLPKGLEGVDQMISKMKSIYLSKEYISNVAAQDWMSYVTNLVGVEISLGESYQFEAEQPLPGSSIKAIKTNTIISTKADLIPCRRGHIDMRCIAFEARTIADPAGLEITFGQMGLDQVRKAVEQATGKKAVYSKMLMNTNLSLTTEPENLIPHSYNYSRRMAVDFEAEGTSGGIDRTDTKQISFTYF
ncbi:hypothetical protein KC963_00255 [Candidatus Saccharibacteria bacterium]|nr:hypothetical protein [Candidatus Saccharibacteria bacterium]